jgi:hypothetical protein
MKNKISITLNENAYNKLIKHENKSKYIESLIFNDLLKRNKVKKDMII